jgi:hypothetical protein
MIAAGPLRAASGAECGVVRELSAAVFTEHAGIPFVFYDAGEEVSVQYDTMKTGKINRKTEKTNKKWRASPPL